MLAAVTAVQTAIRGRKRREGADLSCGALRACSGAVRAGADGDDMSGATPSSALATNWLVVRNSRSLLGIPELCQPNSWLPRPPRYPVPMAARDPEATKARIFEAAV